MYEVDGSPYREVALPQSDVLRFLHAAAAGSGMPCTMWRADASSFVEARFSIARDCLELRVLDGDAEPLSVPLGYLTSAKVAADADEAALPSGVGSAWADCVVLLEYYEESGGAEPRTECLLLTSDVEAALLCRSLAHLQRWGIAPPGGLGDDNLPAHVVRRARAALATLESAEIQQALQRWRAGAAWGSARGASAPSPAREARAQSDPNPIIATASRSTFVSMLREGTQGVMEMLWSPATHPWRLGSKPDPSLACGWDVPQPHNPGGRGMRDALAAEGELCERWGKVIGSRRPAELSRGELRAVFAVGDRIPWQYRLSLWLLWLGVEDRRHSRADNGGRLRDADYSVDEVCKRQVEKDMSRTRPGDLSAAQCESLGRVLRAYASRTPSIGYCQGMNFIVAVVLLAGFTEEQALEGLGHLVQRFCEAYYEESMRGLLRDVAVLDALLSLMLPEIHARLAQINLPLIWIAAEPFLTLFARGALLESVCRLWDFFLIEGPCATFAVFLAYAELAHERNLLRGEEAEDALGAFALLLGDAGAIAENLLRRAAMFLAPRPFGRGLNETLLEGLRRELSAQALGPI